MVKSKARFRIKLISIAVASCFATSAALANPRGGVTTHGTPATITNPAANVLNVQTYSAQTIINWGSFSISVGELTRFMQPGAASAVLNRIAAGASPSSILGSLESNGRVFLINPNGIAFGAGSQINVAGLVASTLNLTDADFLAGRMRFGDGLGKTLANEGNITTPAGGSVFLVGSAVTNKGKGIITSPNGEVILAAGNSVELVNPGTPNLRVEIAAADNEARNLGQIISDAGRIGIYAGLINNSGTIRADSAVSEGSRIVLKATKSTTLEDSSVLSAQGQGGGEIKVLADESVHVAGRLDASSPIRGDGGFIETSAARVHVDSDAIVTTAALLGNTGIWLIDPNDFTIGTDILGAVLGLSLDSTSVLITSAQGRTLGNGDIFVNDAVSWSSSNTLTLTAVRNVSVNSSVTNTGNGTLTLYAGWDGLSAPDAPIITSGIGQILLNAPINFTDGAGALAGQVLLTAGNGIAQTLTGPVTASALLANGGAGNVDMQAANMVGTLAGRISVPSSPSTSRFFKFKNAQTLNIGSVAGVDGVIVSINPDNFQSYVIDVDITATSGDLNVTKQIQSQFQLLPPGPTPVGQAPNFTTTVDLTAAQDVNVSNGVYGSVINLSAGRDINVTGLNVLEQGIAASGEAGPQLGVTPNARVVLHAGRDIAVTDSSIFASAFAGFTGSTSAITLTADTGSIDITTSNISAALSEINFGSGGQGSSTVTLNAGNGITVSGSTILAGNSGGTFFFASPGSATVSLNGNGGPVNISNSTISAFAGQADDNGFNALVSVAGNGITVNASTLQARGGFGNGSSESAPGTGGAATISLNGGSGSIQIQGASTLSANGGSGSPNGGQGNVSLTAGSISVTDSTISSTGGSGFGSSFAGGAGGLGLVMFNAGSGITISNSNVTAAGGRGFSGVAGGAGSVIVTANAGNVTVQGFSTIRADGAEGGTSVVNLVAPGDITVTSSTIQAGDTCCTAGTNGGASTIELAAGGNITVDGGEGGLFANGGSGQMNGGVAAITLTANGGITVNQASVQAFGGSGFAGNGGDANVKFTANGGSILIQNTPFSIEAFGGAGPITGGGAAITMVAASGIIIDGSTVNATAYPFNCDCNPPQNGGLGLVSLNANAGTVDLLNGSVVEASGGGGIVTSGSAQINMTFTGRTSGGYFIDGVEGLIVDDLLLPTAGFFVNGEPAILNTNLIATYFGGQPIFNDILVATMNQQADVLADQLRAGETGETDDKEKKKLALCN